MLAEVRLASGRSATRSAVLPAPSSFAHTGSLLKTLARCALPRHAQPCSKIAIICTLDPWTEPWAALPPPHS